MYDLMKPGLHGSNADGFNADDLHKVDKYPDSPVAPAVPEKK